MPAPTIYNALARTLLHMVVYESSTSGSLHSYGPSDADAYNRGEFGLLPQAAFRSSPVVAPKILKSAWKPDVCEAEDDLYYFLAPYGLHDWFPGPMILDGKGDLVWRDNGYPQSYGLTVQDYRGEPHLTWWSGNDAVHGHGVGSYYILDTSYRLRKKQGAFNDLPADLHEFVITKENTAISTSFVSTLVKDDQVEGYVWDGVFQEYDMETETLKFEWRSSNHFANNECRDSATWAGNEQEPRDYFHINGVEKDNKGNYLVSARYCGILYIDGRTGAVLWQLGGPHSSFRDLSDGKASNFAFQHHARWADNYGSITLFDNQANSDYGYGIPSRGLKLEINQEEMTVRLLNELIHPSGRIGWSQGSMQSLANGNFLVGYGHTGAATEFYPDGKVACDIQFSPLNIGKNDTFMGGAAQSYRVFKQRWNAQPWYDPDISISDGDSLYVSWNGATEVRHWRLEGTSDGKKWKTISQPEKSGFETKIEVKVRQWTLLRLTALDRHYEVIKRWNVFKTGGVQALETPQSFMQTDSLGDFLMVFVALFGCVAAVVVGLTICWFRRCHRAQLFRFSNEITAENDMSDDESDVSEYTMSYAWSETDDYDAKKDEKRDFYQLPRSF